MNVQRNPSTPSQNHTPTTALQTATFQTTTFWKTHKFRILISVNRLSYAKLGCSITITKTVTWEMEAFVHRFDSCLYNASVFNGRGEVHQKSTCLFGKVSVITCIFIYFIILIDVFFDVDSKSTIGFRRSHVVFELWRFKITRKIFLLVKNL